MNALIDTCIVIDALQAREPFFKDARNVFLACASDFCHAYLTAKEVTDIYYLTHRILHSKEATEQIMSRLFVLFSVLDTSAEDAEQAIAMPLPDYEDGVMVQTAKREGMDCIVTRNLKDYKGAGLSVYAPNEFLDIIHYDGNSE